MTQILAKIRCRKKSCKYRKVVSTDKEVCGKINSLVSDCIEYDPNTRLESGEQWYKITCFSEKEFYDKELDRIEESSAAYPLLERNEWEQLNYLFWISEQHIYFQRIRNSMFIRKKKICLIGNSFVYVDNKEELALNDKPDAIYDKVNDILYFQKLQSLTQIFCGIDILYKEATNEETAAFLQESFIILKDGFDAEKVKSLNRKKIAMLKETLANLSDVKKAQTMAYIASYKPDLNYHDNAFEIASDEDLKYLLYGLQERFYTTPIGNKKRIANSIIPIE